MDYKEMYDLWRTADCFDADTKKELEAIKDDENEIQERFYKQLEFGTAGLRGIIGAGTNRMNYLYCKKGYNWYLPIILTSMNVSERSQLLLHLIQEECHLNLQMRQHFVLLPTILRHTYLRAFVQHLSFHLQYVNLDVLQVLILLPVIIHLNITATRYTGKMEHRLHHLMTKELWTVVSAITDYSTR